jgi:Ca2+-binding RTX toxin-like protein
LQGGDGVDTASYSDSNSAVNVSVSATLSTTGVGGYAAGDLLTGIENLIGSSFNDVLTGGTTANRLEGGAGNDLLRGGAGADTLIGGDGVDIVDYSTSTSGVIVQLTAVVGATTTGGTSSGYVNPSDAQGDILSGIESIIGSNLNNTLVGSSVSNKITSGASNDTLRGGSGSDVLSSNGAGQKLIYGDGVNDGGAAGADQFRILGGTNYILDYQTGEDVIANSITSVSTTVIGISGVNYYAVNVKGAAHNTYVVLGTTTALTAQGATAAANTFVTNDLFLDPGLIA